MDGNTPRIYVGTYHKYNAGSIAGAWVDLTDEATFWENAKALHSDEADPELMFQDFEGFPRALYGESALDARVWEYLATSDSEQQIIAAYWENVDGDADVDTALDAYAGTYTSEAEWAESFLEDTGSLNEMPEYLRCYFDYESYARDCWLNGDVIFVDVSGETLVFHNR